MKIRLQEKQIEFNEYALKEYNSYIIRHDFPPTNSNTFKRFCKWVEWTSYGLEITKEYEKAPEVIESHLKNLYHMKLIGTLLD